MDIYIILLFSSIGIGILYGILNYKKLDTSKKELFFFGVFICIFGLFGSRFFSFLFRIHEAFGDIEQLKSLLFTGFMFYGGIIGGLIGIYIYAKRYKLDFLKYLDFCVVVVPLCQMIGRIGCFFSGCCYGIPVDESCFLGHYFTVDGKEMYLLATQLIESAFNLVLFIALWILSTKKLKKGIIAIIYCFTYPIFRFIIEFFRYDERGNIGFLSTSQFISILFMIYGLYLIFQVRKDNNETY